MESKINNIKQRYRYNEFLLRNIPKKTTELATYFWKLKDNITDYKIKQEILNKKNQSLILSSAIDFAIKTKSKLINQRRP